MVQNCVVEGCGSKWYPGCSLIFHSFPKDPTRRRQWLSNVKLKNIFYETAKICSNHFVTSDYIMENRLKQTAIPFFSDVLEPSELKSDASAVSVYYTPVRHDTIFPATPSTSRYGLSDNPDMVNEKFESVSGASPVTRGVLFILYCADICNCIRNCNYHLYADDLQVYISYDYVYD